MLQLLSLSEMRANQNGFWETTTDLSEYLLFKLNEVDFLRLLRYNFKIASGIGNQMRRNTGNGLNLDCGLCNYHWQHVSFIKLHPLSSPCCLLF